MLLERIKKALGLRTVPEDVGVLWAKARTEREALDLLEQACRRDEERMARGFADLDVLMRKEQELLAGGRAETSEARRLWLARLLRDVRAKCTDLRFRLEQVYDKRLRIYREHLQSLRTIVDLAAEPLPESRAMEDAAIKAREGLEQLDRSVATAEGIAATAPVAPITEEERAILAEFGAPEASPKALPEPVRDPGREIPRLREREQEKP